MKRYIRNRGDQERMAIHKVTYPPRESPPQSRRQEEAGWTLSGFVWGVLASVLVLLGFWILSLCMLK